MKPYADDPAYERDLVTGPMVVRATVDHTSDGLVYSVLVLERDVGALHQCVAKLDADGWAALEAMCREAWQAMQDVGKERAA